MNIKRGDRLPSFRQQVLADGSPLDLTDLQTARFLMKNASGAVVVDTTMVAEPNSVIRYDWGPADTQTVGKYSVEVELTFTNGKKLSLPTDGVLIVNVTQDLG